MSANLRILIVDTYYPSFLDSFYRKNQELKEAFYKKQKSVLMLEMFGNADFYSNALNKLGLESTEVIINNRYLQEKWLEEKGIRKRSLIKRIGDELLSKTPLYRKFSTNWELEILKAQIEDFKPDVIYNKNIGYINPIFWKRMKKKARLLVGQIASPSPPTIFLKPYDLVISSFPHFVTKFRKTGINSEYLKLCFEKSILKKIPKQDRKHEVTFIGGISRAHKGGFNLLTDLAERIKIDVWGYGKDQLDPNSKLYKYHHGEAWGKDMYRLMLQSKITINRHIDVAENYANNMRLYEATGCGALLLTDEKKNLGEIFRVGKEVVVYKDSDDLLDKIKYYLKNEKERKEIAKAGQRRTLEDHNYNVRMRKLVVILEKYL